MRRGHVRQLDFFAVEPDRKLVIESDYGQFGLEIVGFAAQPLADVCVRDNGRFLSEMFVPAGVIAVVMGVEHELQFARIELLECGFNLRRERRELIIHNENSLLPPWGADVPAGSGEHINISRNVRRFDFDFGKVLLLRASTSYKRKQRDGKNCFSFHRRESVPGTHFSRTLSQTLSETSSAFDKVSDKAANRAFAYGIQRPLTTPSAFPEGKS